MTTKLYPFDGIEMKICKKCKEEKSKADFYKHKAGADGLFGKCKECIKEAVRINRKKNHEYYKEYDKKRYQEDPRVRTRHKRYWATDAGKSSMNKSREKWIVDNPKKIKVYNKVNNAVRDGKLIKPDKCQSCKNEGRLEGHHEDYSKPFDVMWLCNLCHTKIHREAKQEENNDRKSI